MGGVQKKLFSSPSFQAQPQSAAMDLRGKICSVNSVLRLQRPRQHLSDPQSPLVMGLKKRGEYATGKGYNRAGKSFNREQALPSPAGSGKLHCSYWFCPATRGPRHKNLQISRKGNQVDGNHRRSLSSIHPFARVRQKGINIRGTHFDGWLWWSVSDEEEERECGWAAGDVIFFSGTLGRTKRRKTPPFFFPHRKKVFMGISNHGPVAGRLNFLLFA